MAQGLNRAYLRSLSTMTEIGVAFGLRATEAGCRQLLVSETDSYPVCAAAEGAPASAIHEEP